MTSEDHRIIQLGRKLADLRYFQLIVLADSIAAGEDEPTDDEAAMATVRDLLQRVHEHVDPMVGRALWRIGGGSL